MQLTKCLCTYISVSDCTNLTQVACYRTHRAIAHETFHTEIIHTVQRYVHTYLQTHSHLYIYHKNQQNELIGTQIKAPLHLKKTNKLWKANITGAAKVLFTICTWSSTCRKIHRKNTEGENSFTGVYRTKVSVTLNNRNRTMKTGLPIAQGICVVGCQRIRMKLTSHDDRSPVQPELLFL